MEITETQIALDKLTTGSRLIVRSRTDWRFAAVSKIVEGRVTLTVCSPSGRTYRLRRDLNAELLMEGIIPVLPYDTDDTWRDNFCGYDTRW
ncbi:MAG TPA: hypothetical protein PLP21_14780 [Pyrinomonadaceae bacterium]|nr:hypothetical protein [Acidobacteriota bacterium]HQZ97584.1 hypothetical protein [Pyrinomonadaceae bacterium]